jgi:uncharacterized membrane protein
MENAGAEGDLAAVLRRNIRLLREKREEEESRASFSERLSRAITNFTGSIFFVLLHLLLFGFWLGINIFGPLSWRFDPTFVVLAMFASVEAIFLSTFILISQNRGAAAERKRAELDLQINLLAEHEITRLIDINMRLAARLGVSVQDPELEELKRDVAPDEVLETMTDFEEQDELPASDAKDR